MINELIRKTDVFDLLNDFYSDFEEYSHLFDDIDFMIPVNAVEPKTGRWIDDCGGVKCSCCGYYIDDNYYAKNYCTNCGAKMEVEET